MEYCAMFGPGATPLSAPRPKIAWGHTFPAFNRPPNWSPNRFWPKNLSEVWSVTTQNFRQAYCAWPKCFEILTDLSKGEWFFVVNWVKSVGRYDPRSILFSDGVRGQTIHVHLHVSANFLVRQKLTWDDLKQHRSFLLPPFPLKQCIVCRLSLAYLNRALGCNNAIYRRFCEGIELFVIATHKVRL